MNVTKSHNEETSEYDIPAKIQTIIDNIDIDSEWKSNLFGTEIFIYLDSFLRAHPLYKKFYIGVQFVDEQVKVNLTSLKKANRVGFLEGIMTEKQTEIGEFDFDETQIANIINFKFNTNGIFVDDFVIKFLDKNSLHNFITILLLCQLKTNPINVTDFVNSHYLTEKMTILTYEGFDKYYNNLNGLSENLTTNLSIRLASIVVYNYYVNQLGLSGIIETVKYLHSSKIEAQKRFIDGKELDDMLGSHYIIDKMEFQKIASESFTETCKTAKVIELMGRLNAAPGIALHYLISQHDFNNFFSGYGEDFKIKILGYFDSKTAKKLFQERIEQIMIDAKAGKFMNRSYSNGIADYGTRRKS